jgi:hypothetical protein
MKEYSAIARHQVRLAERKDKFEKKTADEAANLVVMQREAYNRLHKEYDYAPTVKATMLPGFEVELPFKLFTVPLLAKLKTPFPGADPKNLRPENVIPDADDVREEAQKQKELEQKIRSKVEKDNAAKHAQELEEVQNIRSQIEKEHAEKLAEVQKNAEDKLKEQAHELNNLKRRLGEQSVTSTEPPTKKATPASPLPTNVEAQKAKDKALEKQTTDVLKDLSILTAPMET